MIFTFLISIAFLGEIILSIWIWTKLLKLDKSILELDNLITNAKSGIQDIGILTVKISEQIVELSENYVAVFKQKEEDTLLKILNKALITLLLLRLNSKTLKKIRRSKFAKTLSRGFNIIQSMV